VRRHHRRPEPALGAAKEREAPLAVDTAAQDDNDGNGHVVASRPDPYPDRDVAAAHLLAVASQRLEPVGRSRFGRACGVVRVGVARRCGRVGCERLRERQPLAVADKSGKRATGPDFDAGQRQAERLQLRPDGI
jgi:hypothetical protein